MGWSQHGEDVWLEDFIVRSKLNLTPVIIDIGAGDGLDASNSRLFIQKYNYQGFLIDANKEKIAEAKKLYKHNNEVHCFSLMISDKAYKAKLHKLKGKDWKWSKVIPCDKSDICTVTLSRFVDDNRIKNLGIMSIDIEGLDTCVMKEVFKNSTVRPECIIIEGNDEDEKLEQRRIIRGHGYKLIKTMSVNQIFIRESFLI